jgi:hypothetical protein
MPLMPQMTLVPLMPNSFLKMNNHRYKLEPYKGMSSRHHCPSCQHREKTFALYIDTETGEHLHPTVGRCNRESNCGNHYTPKQYFQDNNILFDAPKEYKPRPVAPKLKPVSFIPVELLKASLNNEAFEENNFIQFLIGLFGVEVASELISRYFIATSKHWNGATVFWQIDQQGKIRTGKIMLYSPSTGKRIKEPYNHIHWVHKALKMPEFELRQCFFGEHLLIDKIKPVAIVESEKTAIIASIYLPQFIWLAVGSLTNLNAEKCSILKGRTVALFPDLNGLDKWSSKAKELSHLAIFSVSDLLERKATEEERKKGLDLADYLVKFNYKEFKTEAAAPVASSEVIQNLKKSAIADILPATESQTRPLTRLEPELQPIVWADAIAELETYFASIKLPTQPIRLSQCSTITDSSLFIESHLATVKANNGKKRFLPYLNRLQELKQLTS